eukprot:snap_masked-scaffold_56-processed-gene-1.27-mRNA-1 protein AED:1.00 eAED:1.00 QI:0/-1/0/0/-1/1/1/0/374
MTSQNSTFGILLYSIALTYTYHILGFRILRRYLNTTLPKLWFFNNLNYKGKNNADTVEEFKYVSILTVHHLVGGAVMLLAWLINSPTLFYHGIILEIADDLHDSVVLLTKQWPFEGNGNDNLAKIVIPHHLFGIVAGPIALKTSLSENVHAMGIGAGLLCAGGISLLVLTIRRTIDREGYDERPTDAWKEFSLRLVNYVSVMVFRWVLFPIEIYRLAFVDGYVTQFPPLVVAVLIFAIGGMVWFNLIVAVTLSTGLWEAYELAKSKMYVEKAVEIFQEWMVNANEAVADGVEDLKNWDGDDFVYVWNGFKEEVADKFVQEVQQDFEKLKEIDWQEVREQIENVTDETQYKLQTLYSRIRTRAESIQKRMLTAIN